MKGQNKLGILGLLIGGIIGYLFRPSIPLIGQLPFSTVITAGASLEGFELLLKPIAQESFRTMIVPAIGGMILGAIVGGIIESYRSKK